MAFKMAASRKKLNVDTHRWLTYIKWFSCMCLMITGSLGATLTRLVSKYGRKEVSGKGPDFRGQGLGPQASHKQRAFHQTLHILFLTHDSCLRDHTNCKV